MAMASCMWCKRGANELTCPNCGGPMVCDEIFEAEDGGPYPMLQPKALRSGSRNESIFADLEREEKLAAALREIEQKFGRPATPLEKAIASIEAKFGKGSISVGR